MSSSLTASPGTISCAASNAGGQGDSDDALSEELERTRGLLEAERKSTEELMAEIERLSGAKPTNGAAPAGDEVEQLQIALNEALAERDRLERRLHAVGAFDIEG